MRCEICTRPARVIFKGRNSDESVHETCDECGAAVCRDHAIVDDDGVVTCSSCAQTAAIVASNRGAR